MNENNGLAKESIGRLLLKYSVPAILGMVVTSFYNIADRAFIGSIKGSEALAISGLGITMPIFTLIVGFGVLVAMGCSTNIAIKLGEGNKNLAEKYLGNSFTLSIIISIIMTIFGLVYIDEILILFGASENTLSYAKDYISVIFIGTVFNITGFSLNYAIRSGGNPKMAAITMVAGCVINLILDPVFIFALGLGIKGAAIATIISQAIIFFYVLSYFFTKKSSLKLRKNNLTLDGKITWKILIIGFAPFLMEISTSIVHLLFNHTLKSYGGDISIGAMTAITSIALLFLMPVFGISQGVQTIIGYNYGAGQYSRSKKALVLSVIISTIIMIIGFILIEIFPRFFIGIFNSDEGLLEIGIKGLRIYSLTMPILALSIVGPIYFQSIGKAKHSMLLFLLRQVIILIPLLLILPSYFGLIGIFIAQPIADVISAVVVLVFLIKEFKKESI